MTDTSLSLAYACDTPDSGATSALLQAKALILNGRRSEAGRVLEVTIEEDLLADPPERALAWLALALIAVEDGRRTKALRLLEQAETLLVLTEHEDAIVRWDISLARCRALADSGEVAESATCARTAVALFEDSTHTVAWNRPALLELERLALADEDPCTPFLLPKALGALRLTDHYAALQWLDRQEQIVRELLRRGSSDLAADHAAKALCAWPVDLFGADAWWPAAMQYLGRMGAPKVLGAATELVLAFSVVEREYDRVCDYEDAAPLLLRQQVTGRYGGTAWSSERTT